MSAITDELELAKTAKRCAELVLTTGETLLTGVSELDLDNWTLVVFAPQTFGDNTTLRRVHLDHVLSAVVTDVEWT